jgi:hypothetical protein
VNSATRCLLAATLLAAPPVPAVGEEGSAPERERIDSLRLQIVVARFRGEERIASSPYSMLMSVDDEGSRSLVRMGVEVPVPTTRVNPSSAASDAEPPPMQSFSYRNVGTDIDCRAVRVGDRFRLHLTVEHSTVLNETVEGSPGTSLAPLFNTFRVSLNPILGDGETATVVASTDPVTGQVVRVEVALSVLR